MLLLFLPGSKVLEPGNIESDSMGLGPAFICSYLRHFVTNLTHNLGKLRKDI